MKLNSTGELLTDPAGIYEITNLKREPRDFSRSEIRREIERGGKIKELYRAAARILPRLEISNQSVAFYASLLAYYRVDKLKRFDSWTTRLYLLCFIYQRCGRLHDILINCLLYRVRQYTDQAKEFAAEKLSAVNLTTNQNIVRAAPVLQLLVDEQIPAETPFGEIRERACSILNKDEITQLVEYLLESGELDETELRWEYIDKIAFQFKLNLRPLLTNIEFSGIAETSDLLTAASFLRTAFEREQTPSLITTRKFRLAFIPEKLRRYFYRVDSNSKKKCLLVNRYEFFVYQSLAYALAYALSAGDINCRESLKFRSFEDDLIDEETWRQNKESLIEQTHLPLLRQPIEEHLERLKNQLETRLGEVNQRVADSENPSFRRTSNGSRWSLKYRAEDSADGEETQSDSFFNSISLIELYQVIRFVHEETGFINAFTHLRGKSAKQTIEPTIIVACLMAWGTNTGLGKMSKISDLTANALQTASDNFLRPETLSEANRRIVDEIAEFALFDRFNINAKVHSSSDGQKFETRRQTVNARYSPKYFGLKKGIVAYTLVANHIPINARVIGANEHESHFVFDVLFNNTTKIQPEIHSTDSHGSNQVNFALLHLFGYQFAPRFKDIYETVNKSLYGFEHPSRYPDYQIKPIRKINQKLIVKEWDNILRIILSLANKTTTQFVITRKLASYTRTNQTKQALWEYDNIIRSLYLLEYIDSPPLRQNVQQAINRGENYHQLKRAVAFANFGKLRFKSEYEQNIWNESARLLTNCILYYNLTLLSELIKEKERSNLWAEAEIIKGISPTGWQHINLAGRYEFKQPMAELNIAEIIKEIKFIPLAGAKTAY